MSAADNLIRTIEMIVLIISKCPPSLRGDLTKWLLEISTGVFVGRLSARVRDELWERTVNSADTGKALMVFERVNEQHLDFRLHNCDWSVEDFDGLKLTLKPFRDKAEKQTD